MVTHTLNLCSAFNPSQVHTHSSEHTRSSGQPLMLPCPGKRWRFGALPKGTSVVVFKVERAVHSLPPPAGPRLLQPLDYESNSLTIRPQLIIVAYLATFCKKLKLLRVVLEVRPRVGFGFVAKPKLYAEAMLLS